MEWVRRFFLIFFIILKGASIASGQQSTCRWVSLEKASTPFLMDSLSALQETIIVKDNNSRSLPFEYNINYGFIKIAVDGAHSDSIEICYRTLPYSLHQIYTHRTLLADYDSTALFKDNRKAASEAFDFRE